MNPELHRQILRGRRPVRADHRLRTDEKRVRTQSAILIKTPRASLGLSITVFLVRMRFSSVPKTGLARGARNGRSVTLSDETGYFELHRQILRGRRPVRADRRLRTDEKRVRTQSAILIKAPRASLGLSKTVFLVRMRFSSVPKTGLARGARNGRSVIFYEKNLKPSLDAKCGWLGALHG